MTEPIKTPVKYLTNKEFLAEIHKSKLTFCSYTDKRYAMYDAIVATKADITNEVIEAARIRKAHLMSQVAKATLRSEGAKQTELKEAVIDPASIPTESIVFRVMTSEHIPLDPERKRKGKGENANHKRTPFLPFKHFYIDTNGVLVEVLRSHWVGDFETGNFDMERGAMTHRLAVMFMLLVERYSRRANWRNYTYLDEMKSHALLQLSQIGLQFNEAVSDNPFSFYTTVIKNCVAGDTEILTQEYGSIAIEKISEQDVTLLDGNGDWVKCHIFEHGEKLTQELIFSKGPTTVTVRSTMDHGWVGSDGKLVTTSDLMYDESLTVGSLSANESSNTSDVWTVKHSGAIPKIERVFCPVVETTGTFALASGIHSSNCFTRILNLEKKNQNIRDDILIMNGATPSYTRQTEAEYARALNNHSENGFDTVTVTVHETESNEVDDMEVSVSLDAEDADFLPDEE